MPFKGILTQLRNEGDSREQDCPLISNHLAFKELVVKTSFVYELCPIAKSLSGVQVPQEHQWHIFLEAEVMSGKSIRTQ